MALDKQIHMYSCDTGHFYSNREAYLHNMNCKYRQERSYLKNRLSGYRERLMACGYSEDDLSAFLRGDIESMTLLAGDTSRLLHEYLRISHLIKHKSKKAACSKDKLCSVLKNKLECNKTIERLNSENPKSVDRKPHHERVLREEWLNDTDVISVFDSELLRMIGAEQDELTDALVVVQVYYFDMFEDIFRYGFTFHGELYRYFTSSAGQIRKKKAVFIKDRLWREHEKTILCGLTIDKINAKGGCNVNKFLAYMALSNSATDEWTDFDIDKSIVIDDFETDVFGTYDYIDDSDYSITRKQGAIPITHTDGAGMVLTGKNRMFRAPWIKGLLGVFDFVSMIQEHNWSPVIKDIYGQEHDVIAEDIQVIFTKSQFKLYKYYNSWDEYKECFKRYNCKAAICNVEEDRFRNAKINYQMLQTLTDVTEEETKALAAKSIDRITNLCTSVESMKEALGVTAYNTDPTAFQEAVRLYPALLNDTYAKDTIRSIKNSLLHKYRSGKLEINGKYTFLLPDYYAACEHWFGHIDTPRGLLQDNEVFCQLFTRYEKLDCLRSPHLYKEHAIRTNIAYKGYEDRASEIRKWFTTNAIYTSSHDLVSKILQFDVDGDKSLVVADPLFVEIAERNMQGIVPLYYNMRKASEVVLNAENIYSGLNAAFIGGNIGIYSNNISKIWNDDVFITGNEREKAEAVEAVKLLCCENNFVIDYAKTLYKPTRPKSKNDLILQYTHKKLPAFFEFAKDKAKSQVEKRNNSLVNRLYGLIPNKPINTKRLNLDKIDYRKLMGNVNIRCTNEVKELYDELNHLYRYALNMKDERVDNMGSIACHLREQFTALGYSVETLTDMLVHYTYGSNQRYKEVLWFCFGRQIVENIKRNVEIRPTKFIQCIDCDEWVEVDAHSKRIRCEHCQALYRKQYRQKWMQNKRANSR